jgi:hypothetical protein
MLLGYLCFKNYQIRTAAVTRLKEYFLKMLVLNNSYKT